MNRLTASLITLNEEQNLPRVLASLEGVADEIVVVDSGSTDRTCEMAREAGARVLHRRLVNFAEQRNFAAAQATHDWILLLAADEELSPKLQESVRKWKKQPAGEAAYGCNRLANYLGGWVRHSGWYPDFQVRLYRRDRGHCEGVPHDTVKADGPVGRLEGDLYHYAYRSFAEHAAKVNAYTTIAARQLFAQGKRRRPLAMLLAPPWAFLHKFVIQAGFLDGYRGLLIAWMAARYVFLKFRKLGVLARGGQLERVWGEAQT